MNTSEVLYEAANLIEFRGWAGREVESSQAWGVDDVTSPICLEGGIIAAMGGEDVVPIVQVDKCPAYRAVHRYLELPSNQRLYHFNDARDRTAAEVIEVLRAAAVIEAAKERADVHVVEVVSS